MAGKVYLVGAGPGDPDLLTVKAIKALAAAQAVVYDRLVSPEILAMVPDGVTRIDVGKQAGRHTMPQAEINRLLVNLARTGRTVVRLKGGDPLIFGRGSEEALELAASGIAYEVVPGITSAQGCAASVGVPLTHRGLAQGVRFVTGHCQEDRPLDLDWTGLSDPRTTLVVYMGLAAIGEITSKLIGAGLSGDTPALAVWQATTPRQRQLRCDLRDLARRAREAGHDGPVLFVIGRVLAMALAVDEPAGGMAHETQRLLA